MRGSNGKNGNHLDTDGSREQEIVTAEIAKIRERLRQRVQEPLNSPESAEREVELENAVQRVKSESQSVRDNLTSLRKILDLRVRRKACSE
jgi:hypothetical protein